MRLNRDALSALDPRIERPTFDLDARRAGIVHIGPGAFHRAHMARYAHDLMATGEGMDSAIVELGLLPADAKVAEALNPQDSLYALVERDAGFERVCVIGSVLRVLGPDEVEAGLAAIADPAVRIVSLTVSEAGYGLDAERRLDPANPSIAADLADPRRPRSPVGVLVEAYRRRCHAGGRAFTALSCDNMQDNGRVLHRAVVDFAGRIDPALADWIDAEARFPGSMVDRITPVTRPDQVEAFTAEYGVEDAWPVFCEPFAQWIVEDDFADGRPDWDRVGARFVGDVRPYELMKLRLLNGSHLAVCGLGRLLGLTHVHETMADDRLRGFMAALMREELAPTLPDVPGVDLAAYQARLIQRFANPTVLDTVERVNTDAPIAVLTDPIRNRRAAGASFERLGLGLAAWIRRLALIDDPAALTTRHPQAERLHAAARSGGTDPRPVLAVREAFGDLGDSEALVETLAVWLDLLERRGVEAALVRAG